MKPWLDFPGSFLVRLTLADVGLVLAALLGLLAAVMLLELLTERRHVQTQLLREQAFWLTTLEPWRDDPNFEFNKALDGLCSREFEHPVRGRFRPTRVEVLRWFDRIRSLDRERVERTLSRRQKVANVEPAAKSKPVGKVKPAPVLAARPLRRS